MQKNVIMSVDHLSKDFVIRGKKIGEKSKLLHALSDVSFDIYEVKPLASSVSPDAANPHLDAVL